MLLHSKLLLVAIALISTVLLFTALTIYEGFRNRNTVTSEKTHNWYFRVRISQEFRAANSEGNLYLLAKAICATFCHPLQNRMKFA